ncbi:MAG: adenylyl-sulfate kinase [Candidatus Marinimicrobia bacterium]|nr:adenylyl-sulfate kinase [Candidatus Neomarinimicrobiota bacterium]MCH8305605.1 adenylyl-sulfate kinase [Candidatus Neomarinimicrobiota bacterium]TFB10398.1 adenylyl-sulfate kinase [Candidatus Marinimicrobia bacterium MT.SAG.2]
MASTGFYKQGTTLWMTGLSGAGKTTIANLLAEKLIRRGEKVEILDGDVIRTNLSKGLGFSKEDRETNLMRIGFVCRLLSRNGAIAIAAAISPYDYIRKNLRKEDENFIEVYVNAPIEKCIERDVKGLYKKALAGEIKQFTGIDDPYEAPEDAEIEVHTDKETVEESVEFILRRMEELGRIEPDRSDEGYSSEEEAFIQKRLEALGYI